MDYIDEMDRKEARRLLLMAMLAGRIMLKNGAETYRVEDTIERICKSRKQIQFANAFVTPTGIFASLEFKEEPLTSIFRIKSTTINLSKIVLVNDFSRKFVNSDMTIDEGFARLKEIEKEKDYSPLVRNIFTGAACAFFSPLFGGTFIDSITSFIIAFISMFAIDKANEYKLTLFISNFIGSSLVTVMATVFSKIGLGINIDAVIISSIMPLLPGVSLTNALRDTMSGDFLSGMTRAMEAMLSALAIALGVGFILNFYHKGVF